MATSALNYTLERLRQNVTGDNKFFKKMLMFFELKVPASVGGFAGTSFLFPLIVMPQSENFDEPFTVEVTPTQGGGLYVEENGIVQRTIKISGTTGFKPRKLNTNGTRALGIKSPEKKSFGRRLNPWVIEALSGQRHIHYLQDAVFRTYGDLKRDPNLAENVKLIFHIPKDDESWLVVPQKFSIERSSSRATLYSYSIDLLIVDAAVAIDEDFTEDTWLDKVKDAVQDIKTAIDLAQGAINDLTAVVGQIKGYVKNIAVIIDGVQGVINAASNFVQGVTDLVMSPLTIIESMAEVTDAALAAYDTLEQSKETLQNPPIPPSIRMKLMQLTEAMERIATHPEVTAPDSGKGIHLNNLHSDARNQISANERTNPRALTSLADAQNMGTAVTAGDIQIADGKSNVPKPSSPNYRSGKQVSITEGDTLATLAAKHLGDARLWQDLAVVNGLKPPFINKQASLDLTKADEAVLPGSLGIGDKIVIPSTSKGPVQLPILPVLGVKPWEPLEVQLLGRDMALELVEDISTPGNPKYDIPIDVEGGSVDVKLVAGLDNLAQGLTQRLNIEKGTDTLYKRLGLERVVGLNIAPLDLETTRFRLSQCIQQDPRIASVRQVIFQGLDNDTELDPSIPLDAVVADITAEVRGFTESANVRIVL